MHILLVVNYLNLNRQLLYMVIQFFYMYDKIIATVNRSGYAVGIYIDVLQAFFAHDSRS